MKHLAPLVAVAAGALAAAAAPANAAIKLDAGGVLVDGSRLRVTADVPAGATRFTALADGRDVTGSFRVTSAGRVAVLRGLKPGRVTISVRARVKGRTQFASKRLIVRGARTPMIKGADEHAGILRHVAGGAVPIAFSAPLGARVQVRLNGRTVPSSRPAQGGVRHAILSHTDGLRRGRNSVRILVYKADGSYDSRTRGVQVAKAVPMAAAGKDVRARVGDRVKLDASNSSAGSKDSTTSYSWKLVEAPDGVRTGAVHSGKPRTSLKLRRAGHYAVAMTMTEQRRGGGTVSSTDVQEVEALAATPALGARVSTMAPAPNGEGAGNGVLVDMRLRPSDATDKSKYHWIPGPKAGGVSVYAFDPISLKPIAELPGNQLDTANLDDSLNTALGTLKAGDIVIVVGDANWKGSSSHFPQEAFSHVWAYDGNRMANIGAGTWNRGLVSGSPDAVGAVGALTGYFREDSEHGRFRFVQDGDVPFTTSVLDRPTLGPADGATYRIREASGVNLAGGAARWNQPAAAETPSNDVSQQWQLQRAYGNYFMIDNSGGGGCLDLSGRDGVSILQWQCDTSGTYSLNQLWMPYQPPGKSFYVLRSALPGSTLAVTLKNGQFVGAAEDSADYTGQQFTFELAPGTYALSDPQSGQVMGEPAGAANGTQLTMQADTEATAQRYRLVYDGSSSNFQLINASSGACADIHGGDTDPGTMVDRWDCVAGAKNELWTADADADGIRLTSGMGGVVLSRQGGKTVSSPDGSTGQRWQLRRAPVSDGAQRYIAMRVGAKTYGSWVPATGSGFVVLALDSALRPLDAQGNVKANPSADVYVTNSGDAGADKTATQSLTTHLDNASTTTGASVLVQSFGRPKPSSDAWNGLSDTIGMLGGDATRLRELDGTGDFAFAGCNRCSGAPAVVGGQPNDDPAAGGARLTGTLTRDSEATYAAGAAGAADSDASFQALTERAQTPWPYDDGAKGTAALQKISDMLTDNKTVDLTPTCAADLGPVRSAYCVKDVGAQTNWRGKIGDLNALQYPSGQPFDEGTFNAVKQQLATEWRQLDDVDSLMTGLETAYTWAGSSQGTAGAISQVISNNLGNPPKRESVAGGVLSFLQDTLSVAIEVGPLLGGASTPVANTAQVSEDPRSPASTIAALLGLSSGAVELAGSNDDASPGVTLEDMRSDAVDFGNDLDTHLADIRDNFVVVENAILSDPTRLALTSDNTSQEWQLPQDAAQQLRTQLQQGAARTLWTKLVPSAYQLWQFPKVPSDLSLQDFYCNNAVFGGHYIYSGQPDSAIFRRVTAVDGSGNQQQWNTMVITKDVDPNLQHDVDRLAHQDLIDHLTGAPDTGGEVPNAGLSRGEVMRMFTPVDYGSLPNAGSCAPLLPRHSGATPRGWAD